MFRERLREWILVTPHQIRVPTRISIVIHNLEIEEQFVLHQIMNNIIHKTEVARATWIRASNELQFQIISPYILEDGARQYEIFAYLPQYGSPNGILICRWGIQTSMFEDPVYAWAMKNHYFYSQINLDLFQNYNLNMIHDALDDWGKYVD